MDTCLDETNCLSLSFMKLKHYFNIKHIIKAVLSTIYIHVYLNSKILLAEI